MNYDPLFDPLGSPKKDETKQDPKPTEKAGREVTSTGMKPKESAVPNPVEELVPFDILEKPIEIPVEPVSDFYNEQTKTIKKQNEQSTPSSGSPVNNVSFDSIIPIDNLPPIVTQHHDPRDKMPHDKLSKPAPEIPKVLDDFAPITPRKKSFENAYTEMTPPPVTPPPALTPEEEKVPNALDILEGPWKDIFSKPAEPVAANPSPSSPETKPASIPPSDKKEPVKPVSGKESALSPIAQLKYYLNQILEDPDNPEPRLNYINLYLEDGLEYDLVDDYLDLANLYRNNQQTEEAIKYYHKVLELDPSVMEAQHKLAIMEGKPPVANTPAEKNNSKTATATAPAQSSPNTTEMTADEERMIAQLRRLLQINPINEIIAKKLADLYRSKGMIAEAVQEMTLVADVYMQRGLYKKANQIYEQLVKDSPSDELRIKLGKSRTYLSSQGAIDDAIKSYKSRS